jgi:hypothetical protein
MAKWNSDKFRLAPGQAWKCAPGYVSIVGDRGAFRFDIPEGWHFVPGTPTLNFYDREPPDDNILLEATPFGLPGAIAWTDLPLSRLFAETTKNARDDIIWQGDPVQSERQGLELLWHETRFIDPGEHREGRSRTLLARRATDLLLLTLSYWPEDAERSQSVWEEVLRSLRMGQHLQLTARRGRN